LLADLHNKVGWRTSGRLGRCDRRRTPEFDNCAIGHNEVTIHDNPGERVFDSVRRRNKVCYDFVVLEVQELVRDKSDKCGIERLTRTA